MAYNAFLKFTPDVKGEADDKGFEGQLEIYSFSFGASNPTTVGQGGGLAAGKVSVSSFNVMKKFDSATPTLFQNCCIGKHFDKAEVTLCKASGSKTPLKFIVIKFDEVFIESIQWSGSSGGDDTPTESISFAFASVKFTYTAQSKTGAEAKPVGAGWNVKTNQPS